MFALVKLLAMLVFYPALAFLRLAITEVKTTQRPGDAEVDGAVMNQGGVVQLITNLKQNAAPVFGNWLSTEISSALAADTYTGAAMVGGIIRRTSLANTTDSLAPATQIVAAIPGAVVGQTFPMMIANLGSGTLTIAGNTGVTLTGTATIARFTTRLFLGQVTGSAAVTVSNQFAFGAAQTVG